MPKTGQGPGRGRYTTYVQPKSTRRTFLEKLFAGDGTAFEPKIGSTEHALPFANMTQAEAIEAAAKFGNKILRATDTDGIISGDPDLFPQGFDLKFTGAGAPISVPDTAAGKDGMWKQSGDPANSYVPDITSPGPGKTEGLDKDVDPKITSVDLKPNYIPGAPGTGTKSPSVTSGKLYDAQTLGAYLNKGESGADD